MVSEDAEVRAGFEKGKVFFGSLAFASEVLVQADKTGISEDAVSAVNPAGSDLYSIRRAGGY